MNHCKEMHQGQMFLYLMMMIKIIEWKGASEKLQDLTLCNMIHPHYQYPSTITDNFWPYAVRHAVDIINENPLCFLNYASTTTQMLSKSRVDSNPRHWKPLLCPVYALDHPISADRSFDKWKKKSHHRYN